MLFFGCSDNSESESFENSTPETLINDEKEYRIDFASKKRWEKDIISMLYKEALDKNPKLRDLDNRINQIEQIKIDSTESTLNYLEKNEDYWGIADHYIRGISDSLLREATIEAFKVLENSYLNKTDKFISKLSEIDKNEVVLRDQAILLKLIITESMIKNYQINEFPNIETLEKINNQIQELSNETKEFINIDK